MLFNSVAFAVFFPIVLVLYRAVPGYVKRVAIADGIARMTRAAFNPTMPHTGAGLLPGMYLFALRIYGDFPGCREISSMHEKNDPTFPNEAF